MATVASRELRNHTADVLRRVSEGTDVTVTLNGAVVAVITRAPAGRRPSMSKRDLVGLLTRTQSDAGLRRDLAVLAGETTDDLRALG
jgi:prevent-host-death family protein